VPELYVTLWQRLIRIAEAHTTDSNVDGHGGVSGYCLECELAWPCPTYRNATEEGITVMCTFDLRDCELHDHSEGAPR
jgi:hypothetical protein